MIPLLQTARELLQTQPTLHPKIFGADERLLPDVRQKIMKTADFMIRQRVSGLYGLKVADIVIVGSAGGYMYHENSDIDVRIFLETDNPTIKNLSFFCQCCCCAELDGDENPLPVFYVNGLFLDIAFAPVRYDSGGNYSVLNDRWATRPRKDNLAARFRPGRSSKAIICSAAVSKKPLQSLIFRTAPPPLRTSTTSTGCAVHSFPSNITWAKTMTQI